MYVCICMHIYYTHERMYICTTSQYNTNTVSTRTPTHNATYICAVCTNYAYQRTCTWYTSFLPIHECISRSKHTNTLCIPSHTYCTYLLHTLIYRLHTRCIPTHICIAIRVCFGINGVWNTCVGIHGVLVCIVCICMSWHEWCVQHISALVCMLCVLHACVCIQMVCAMCICVGMHGVLVWIQGAIHVRIGI